MSKTRRVLSDDERAERRRADRAFAARAVEQLRSSAGWQQWLTARRHFHAYTAFIRVADVASGQIAAAGFADMSLTGLDAVCFES